MKKKFKLIGSVLFTALLVACSSQVKETPLSLLPVHRGAAFSYIDPSGKIIISPQFKEATVFRNRLALVQVFGNKPTWGYITEKGNFAIKAIYKEATIFNEDLAWVVPEDGAPEVINTRAEVRFKLPVAKSVRIFKNGLAAFCISADSTNVKWGFVDKTGMTIIQPQFSVVGNFSEGKCVVANAAGEWGYINQQGNLILNYRYSNAQNFVNGKAIVSLGKQWGVIDEKGNYILSPQFSEMKADKAGYLIKQKNKWGWCNEKGKIIIEPQFDEAYPFAGNKLAPVKLNGKFGYINKRGKMIIDTQFDSALPFNGKIAWVESGHKGGCIDENAKYLINPQYDSISVDLKAYLLTGTSAFETVHSDYFDLNAIINRIKRDITENSVAGMNFSTPLSVIYEKYKKTESDFIRGSEHQIIKSERISNDATLDFFILGSPWIEKYNGNLGFNYTLKPDYTHSGFSYRIKLTGKALNKENLVLKALETALSGYNKDGMHSNEDVTILKNNSQLIVAMKQAGIIIIAIYPITPENLQMIELNYGTGMDADSTAVDG